MENGKNVEGLTCSCGHCYSQTDHCNKEKKGFLIEYGWEICKSCVSIILLLLACFIKTNQIVKIILFGITVLFSGYELFFNTFKNFFKLNFLNELTLMFIATITAFILGEYFESAFIIILFNFGEFLERIATDNSKRKIAGLSSLKVKTVNVMTKEGLKVMSPQDVPVGSFIELKSGELLAIDGVLLGLPTDFDTKAVTGESKYYTVENGGIVFSGSVNVGYPALIRTTKLYKDSTVEKIISMVEGSLSKKAKTQKFITKFAKIYTPMIFAVAFLLAVLPPLFDEYNFVKWIYKALSFLVISCPCALVISVPLAFFIGIGGLAKKGVLVKGSRHIETLSKVDKVVFDKTGTLTVGEFVIDNIYCENEFSKEDILKIVCSLENKSNHPISKAFKNIDSEIICFKGVQEFSGKGIKGVFNDKTYSVGNAKLMIEQGIIVEDTTENVLYVSENNRLMGKIFICDKVKDEAPEAVCLLKKQGVKSTYILSGDKKEIANSVGKFVGIDKVYSEMLPNEKLEKLRELLNDCNKKVAYVGDGINDSPCIAESDVGIAMGGIGSEIAIETADVVIMNDELRKIPQTIAQSKKIRRIVMQNIIGSITVKMCVMILSVVITLPVWIAMFADVGVMSLAVCNSMRASKTKKNIKRQTL